MKAFRFAALLAAALACSCSNSSTTTGTGGGLLDPTAESACTEYALRMCQLDEKCDPYFYRQYGGEASACLTRKRTECVAMLTANGTGATAQDLQTCAAVVSTYSCDDIVANRKRPDECWRRGAIAEGGPCGLHAQCQSGWCDNVSMGTPCGVCGPHAPEGSACLQTNDCDRYLFCSKQVCVPRVPLGGPCDGPVRCLGALACLGADGGSRVCSKPLGPGASCDPGITTPFQCDAYLGLNCDESTRTCTEPKLTPIGESCWMFDPDAGVSVPTGDCGFGLGAYCHIGDGGAGVCRPTVKDGDRCDNRDACIPPAECINSICAMPNPNDCR
jgi:hypothetical protein